MFFEQFACLFISHAVLYTFVTLSRFDCSAASRKGGTGNELVGMVKDGTVCGVNKVTNSVHPKIIIPKANLKEYRI